MIAATLLGVLVLALYSKNQVTWSAFYLLTAISLLRFAAQFIAHRQKYAQLVLLSRIKR